MSFNERVKALVEKTSDAYSFDRYGASGWAGCVRVLIRRGYTDRQIEAILRSKWLRWAGDGSSNRYGHCTGTDLETFLARMSDENRAREVRELVTGTFGVSA